MPCSKRRIGLLCDACLVHSLEICKFFLKAVIEFIESGSRQSAGLNHVEIVAQPADLMVFATFRLVFGCVESGLYFLYQVNIAR
ncbi:hypothetical protein DyAD56_20185 [Dyella sp. AD56]|nr:hypothetical protein DyAD56_20185 [Dyella sp. AD56]